MDLCARWWLLRAGGREIEMLGGQAAVMTRETNQDECARVGQVQAGMTAVVIPFQRWRNDAAQDRDVSCTRVAADNAEVISKDPERRIVRELRGDARLGAWGLKIAGRRVDGGEFTVVLFDDVDGFGLGHGCGSSIDMSSSGANGREREKTMSSIDPFSPQYARALEALLVTSDRVASYVKRIVMVTVRFT